jgi:hypothetical protein
MSIEQVQKDAPDILKQSSDSIDGLSKVVGVVSKLTSLAGLPDVVAEVAKLFFPGKPDPIAQALADIQQRLDVVLHFEVPKKSRCSAVYRAFVVCWANGSRASTTTRYGH